MTIEEIHRLKKHGDIATLSELSGIPYKTIEGVLSGERSATSPRGKQVIEWFTKYLNARANISSIQL